MMKTLLLGCLFVCCSQIARSQVRISNVRFELNTKSKLIEISYDAVSIQKADSVYITATGKKSGNIIPKDVNGAVGKGIKPGKNLRIFWNVVADNLKIDEELVIKVHVLPALPATLALADTARRKTAPIAKKTKTHRGINGFALLTLGTGLAAGGGLYYLSTIKKGEADDAYELYRQRNWNHKNDLTLIGTDPVLKKMYDASYEQAKTDFNEAKKLQRTSKILIVGGIALVVIDAVFTIPVLLDPRNKKTSLRLNLSSGGVASANIQIKF